VLVAFKNDFSLPQSAKRSPGFLVSVSFAFHYSK
jgi:hypothetical protein